MYRLFLGSEELDLPEKFKIARTKQVNTINSLKNRQSNFTQKIQLPQTANNKRVLELLGFNGSTTNKPYEISECRLIGSSGESEIQSGRLVILETVGKEFYRCTIYDGFVNFVKQIENASISDADVSALNHLKNLTTIQDTWTQDLPYRYLVSDYNGKMIYDDGGTIRLNIDYLIPSVKKSFLLDAIFNYAGWTYSGDIFSTQEWINNWMTYPKPIGDGSQVLTLIATFNDKASTAYYAGPFGNAGSPIFRYVHAMHTAPPTLSGDFTSVAGTGDYPEPDGTLLVCNTTGLYKVTFEGALNYNNTDRNITFVLDVFGQDDGLGTILVEGIGAGEEFTEETAFAYINLEAGQQFQIVAGTEESFTSSLYPFNGSVDFKIYKVEGDAVDFEEALIDFDMKEFVQEILWEFALTPFTDSANKHIEFLTAKEWLQEGERINWSSDTGIFKRKISEEYIFGDYGQYSYLRHKYNESDADHNDGVLRVVNANLPDKKDIITSKIYTPDRDPSSYAFSDYIYRIWDKEIKDDGTVDYKELQNRFYYLREEVVTGSIKIGSELQGTTGNATSYPTGISTNFAFKDIVRTRYAPYYSILNTQRVVVAELFINDRTFRDLDFKKLVFIKELGSNFAVNVIKNYTGSGLYPVELLEVDLGVTTSDGSNPLPATISLTSTATGPDGIINFVWIIGNDVTFNNYTPVSGVPVLTCAQWTDLESNGGTPTGFEFQTNIQVPPLFNNSNPFPVNQIPLSTYEGWYRCEVVDTNVSSNVEWVYVGDFNGGGVDPEEVIGFAIPDQTADGIQQVSVSYLNFENPPTQAYLEYTPYDFLSQTPTGPPQQVNLPTTPINEAFLTPVNFGALGYYKWKIVTNIVESPLYSTFIL